MYFLSLALKGRAALPSAPDGPMGMDRLPIGAASPEQLEALLFKGEVILPSVLVIISCHDSRDSVQVRLLELGSDDGSDLFRGVGLYVVHTFLERIREALDYVRVLVDVALLCREGRVRNIAAVGSEGSDYIAFLLFFKTCGSWFKLDRKVALAA